jgi:hypothetical protein
MAISRLTCLLTEKLARFVGIRNSNLLTLKSCHFDFDLHARVRQTCRDHHGCWADVAKILAQHGLALLKLSAIWQNIVHPNHVLQACACFVQRRLNILQALLCLLEHAVCDGHRAVVETCGARNKHPIACDNSAGIADLLFNEYSGPT